MCEAALRLNAPPHKNDGSTAFGAAGMPDRRGMLTILLWECLQGGDQGTRGPMRALAVGRRVATPLHLVRPARMLPGAGPERPVHARGNGIRRTSPARRPRRRC